MSGTSRKCLLLAAVLVPFAFVCGLMWKEQRMLDEAPRFSRFRTDHEGRLLATEREALDWIIPRWGALSGVVLDAVRQHAALVQPDLQVEEHELSLYVDRGGAGWSGRWAVTLSGVVEVFDSPYEYYVELVHDRVVINSAAGLGFNIGANPRVWRKRMQAQGVEPVLGVDGLTAHEAGMLRGRWQYHARAASDTSLNQRFGLGAGAGAGNGRVIELAVADDFAASLQLYRADGSMVPLWHGRLHALDGGGGWRLMAMAAPDQDPRAVALEALIFVTLVSDERMIVWSANGSLHFVKPRPKPLVDYSASPKSHRIGFFE